MLSWSKETRGSLMSYVTKTVIGTAIVHEQPDGSAILDMWRPDQSNIGRGEFANADAAKKRAETILDPRNTAWDLLDHPALDETPDPDKVRALLNTGRRRTSL